jgi:hypothetical protein
MNNPEFHAPAAQPINECPLRSSEPGLAHSKGKPDVSPKRTNINVRFATLAAVKIKIRTWGNDGGMPAQSDPVPLLPLDDPAPLPT